MQERDEALRKNHKLTMELKNLRKRLAKIEASKKEATITEKITTGSTNDNSGDQNVIGRRKDRSRKTNTTMEKPIAEMTPTQPELQNKEEFLESVTKVLEQVIDSKLKENMTEKKTVRRLKNMRAKNLIIHGLSKQSTRSDEALVKEIFDVVQVQYAVKSIARLGNTKPGSIQPLKIVMNNVDAKQKFLKSLHRLKDAGPNLCKISITDDYTIHERKEIATWIMKAKERTAADTGGNVWKVRGSPNRNLRLVKMKVKQPTTTTTTTTSQQ